MDLTGFSRRVLADDTRGELKGRAAYENLAATAGQPKAIFLSHKFLATRCGAQYNMRVEGQIYGNKEVESCRS
jgi:hypothetical protein